MRWSYSSSRSFRHCQKQWYFKNIVASATAKDPLRKKAYLLSKLQSISAWRGKIVDHVISTVIVPSLNRKKAITLRKVTEHARGLFDRQLACARSHPIKNPDLKVSAEGDDFAVFHVMEYDGQIPEQEVAKAWDEIESALSNLFALGALKDLMKSASYLVTQRALQFPLMDGISVIAYPDLIAFRKDAPPLIIDWKVHAFGQNDAWLQLGIYALALQKCKPHADFPFSVAPSAGTSKLFEAQLLTNVVREHLLEEDQLIEAEEYMISSAYEMTCLTEGSKYSTLDVNDFLPAQNAESCLRCAFRVICWEPGYVN